MKASEIPAGFELLDSDEAPPNTTTETLREEPEFHLMQAVFESRVSAALNYREARKTWAGFTADEREDMLEGLAYLIADEPKWLYSFVSVCHWLNLDADEIRRKALAALDMTSRDILLVLRNEGWAVPADASAVSAACPPTSSS